MSHTPAPWQLDGGNEFGWQIIDPATGNWICQLWNRADEDFVNCAENARLIAVAPLLWAACRAAEQHLITAGAFYMTKAETELLAQLSAAMAGVQGEP